MLSIQIFFKNIYRDHHHPSLVLKETMDAQIGNMRWETWQREVVGSQQLGFQHRGPHSIVANHDEHSKGISDRGTTRSIISVAEAKRLRERGIIGSIDWIPLGSSREQIVFGKEGATEPVIATIQGKGLLTTIAVVENVEVTLIADTDFTRHGIVLLQDDTTLVGVYGKEIVFRGVRDSNARAGTSDQLWLLDIDNLLQQAAPTAGVTVETAEEIATMITQRRNHGDINEEQCELFAGRAGPKWTKHAVRLAREVVKNFNNTQHLERS